MPDKWQYWQDIGVKTNVKLIAYSQWVDAEKAGSDLNGAVFGLYGDGTVYQYNFNSNTWMRLGREWSDHTGSSGAENQTGKTPGAAPPRRR